MTFGFYVEQTVKQKVLHSMNIFNSGDSKFHENNRPVFPAGI